MSSYTAYMVSGTRTMTHEANMAKYHLFLDDERNLSDVTWIALPSKITNNWITVRNFREFVHTILSFGIPEFITFDHDLAVQHYGHGLNNDAIPYDTYSEFTGYDCAKWLVDFCHERSLKFPEYVVHSMNPVGSTNIHAYIESAKKHLVL